MSLIKQVFAAVNSTIKTHRAPRWAAEPVRAVANRAMGITATITGVLVVANQMSSALPASYRDKASTVLAGFGAFVVVVSKVAAEVARSKVISPATAAKTATPFSPPTFYPPTVNAPIEDHAA